MPAWSWCAFPRREPLPVRRGQSIGDTLRRAADGTRFAPHLEAMLEPTPSTSPIPARFKAISIAPTPWTLSAATHRNGTLAAIARSIRARASAGLVANVISGGTYAAFRHTESLVQAVGR